MSCSGSEADHGGPLDDSIQTETYASEKELALLQEISMLKELLIQSKFITAPLVPRVLQTSIFG